MGRKVDIRVVSGVSAGDVFHFIVEASAPLVIGRDPVCGLVLQDPTVSRQHASIELDGETLYIVDQGSSHGTIHMGFQIEPGPGGRRILNDGDEFKIGEAIFAVVLPEDQAEKKKKKRSDGQEKGEAGKSVLGDWLRGKRLVYLILLVVLCLLLIFAGGPEGPKLPRQTAKRVLSMPEYRVLGYLPGKKRTRKKLKDKSHPDKVEFYLPTSDAVIEFDYLSEAKVEVYVGTRLVETLPAHWGSPQHRQIVVRDILGGQERKLVFDNTDFPRSKKDVRRKMQRWMVHNVRAAPLTLDLDTSFDSLLEQAASLAPQLDITPDALFIMIRALQKCIIQALAEVNLEAVGFAVNLETGETDVGGGLSGVIDPKALSDRLKTIKRERADQLHLDTMTPNLHLQALVEMTASLDAELWRRFNSRISAATYAAKAKNHIGAHDNLAAAKSMFPEELDYRWVRAERLYTNNKVVPKKVRAKRGSFKKSKKKKR